MPGDQPVTRDALRADLAELKFDLIERMSLLAPVSRVERVEQQMLNKEKVKEIISEALQAAEARGWTRRERLMASVLFLITAATFVLNILAFRGS